MRKQQVAELVYQALETELGAARVYEHAITNAIHEDLRVEWLRYHDETKRHAEILREVCSALALDPDEDTPGRQVLRYKANALVEVMKMARDAGDAEAAQLVAVECVFGAETKDHLNWEVLAEVAREADRATAHVLKAAIDEVEPQEDEHLYHTMGWARELWIDSLGLPAVLPPPEEERHVRTAIGAARAKQARERMLSGRPAAHR